MRVNNKEWRYKIGKRMYRITKKGNHEDIKIGAAECTKQAITHLVEQNKDLFYKENEVLPTTGKTVHRIHLKTEFSIYVKDRRYPQAMREIIREQLEELRAQGIIRYSNSPFNSPLWVVEKKPGEQEGEPKKYRVVVDYRKLNEAT